MMDDEIESENCAASVHAAGAHPYRSTAFAVEPDPPCPEAKTALVFAITGLFCFGILLGPLALRMGQRARQSLVENPEMTGIEMADKAMVIGKIALGLHLILTFLVLVGLFFTFPRAGFRCL